MRTCGQCTHLKAVGCVTACHATMVSLDSDKQGQVSTHVDATDCDAFDDGTRDKAEELLRKWAEAENEKTRASHERERGFPLTSEAIIGFTTACNRLDLARDACLDFARALPKRGE